MTTDGKIRSPGRLLTAAGLVLLLIPVISAGQVGGQPGSRKKPEEFKTGIRAQDHGDWQGSVPLLRLSLEKLPEDGERVRIYGGKYMNYLPHYYLGLAFYRQNNCVAALKEWELSVGVGAVLNTEEHNALVSYLSDCRGRIR
jgi:hypothetical protein